MSPPKPKVMFVVTEDWFFCSHFLPMAKAALADGFDVSVTCRERDHGDRIRSLGCRLLPMEADRKTLNPVSVVSTLQKMRNTIAHEKPDIVHLIALRSIIVGGLAAALAGVPRRVIALTGLGLLGAEGSIKASIARSGITQFISTIVDGKKARYLFENRSDPLLFNLHPDNSQKVTVVGGAGVDPQVFNAEPLPVNPPLRVAMIARMLWSKGADTAVDAIRIARAKGADISLSLYGAPDPDNPKAIAESVLRNWSALPGVTWHGKINQANVPAIWAAHHVAILPSRGGEGLPRTLLEAASCGRAIITTDVPGCRDLVHDGIEGLIVPPNDPAALADALVALSQQPEKVVMMGKAARMRILEGHTEDAVGQSVVKLYRSMLQS
jgi:glycosyltransferase involved in cell wall biosynthesis